MFLNHTGLNLKPLDDLLFFWKVSIRDKLASLVGGSKKDRLLFVIQIIAKNMSDRVSTEHFRDAQTRSQQRGNRTLIKPLKTYLLPLPEGPPNKITRLRY